MRPTDKIQSLKIPMNSYKVECENDAEIDGGCGASDDERRVFGDQIITDGRQSHAQR